MSLTLVTGPANAAKAGHVLERLRAVVHREPLLVVPTAADVSHYGQELAAGGLHLWLRLPDGTDEPALVAAAARVGVLVSACGPSFAAEPTGPHLRLSFGGAPPDVLVEGAARLAALVR